MVCWICPTPSTRRPSRALQPIGQAREEQLHCWHQHSEQLEQRASEIKARIEAGRVASLKPAGLLGGPGWQR